MSMAATALFAVTALFAIIGAVITVAALRPLRAAMGLMVHIVALAGLYLTLQAQLLAALQLLVYAGAVVVLFVFVIMVIGPATEIPPRQDGRVASAVNIALVVAALLPVALAVTHLTAGWGALPDGFGGVESVGQAIYQEALVPFEAVSITLLLAIVGAVAVAQGRTKGES